MSDTVSLHMRSGRTIKLVLIIGLLGLSFWLPHDVFEVTEFVVFSLLDVVPLVVPGIVLAAWISASGAGGRVAEVFGGNVVKSVIAAAAIGAITPVCGITVLPLMVGLLAAGVPLAPVMAFWLSSPVTDPAMLATTAATLGFDFAVGKTLAAIFLGLLGGSVCAVFSTRQWLQSVLRSNSIVGNLGSCGSVDGMDFAVWNSTQRRAIFAQEALSTSRLILICLIPAFAAEFVLNGFLTPDALSQYVGKENAWAIPLAVFVGGPAYVDGYAALPLTRSLMDHGMSPGAAMAFMVSGGVVSIWGAMAIFPVLKIKPFLLYLFLAVTGSLAVGWLYELYA